MKAELHDSTAVSIGAADSIAALFVAGLGAWWSVFMPWSIAAEFIGTAFGLHGPGSRPTRLVVVCVAAVAWGGALVLLSARVARWAIGRSRSPRDPRVMRQVAIFCVGIFIALEGLFLLTVATPMVLTEEDPGERWMRSGPTYLAQALIGLTCVFVARSMRTKA